MANIIFIFSLSVKFEFDLREFCNMHLRVVIKKLGSLTKRAETPSGMISGLCKKDFFFKNTKIAKVNRLIINALTFVDC